MAEGCSGGTWWGSWIEAAKEKSAQAIDFVKADLQEFTQETYKSAETVKAKLTQENVTAATVKAKQGVSSLIGGISKALVIEPEDKDNPGIPITSEGIFDRKKARLRAIQLDTGTYLNAPSGPIEQFEMWLPSFDLEAKKGDISELLVANVEVRALYTQMVPSSVSHADFWQRYFYKVHQLEQDEQRKKLLMQRADDSRQADDLAWDDEDDWGDVVGSPPKSPPVKPASPATDTTDTSNTTTTTTAASTEQQSDNVPMTQDDPSPAQDSTQAQPVPTSESGDSTSQTVADIVSPTETLSLSTTDSSRDITQGSSSMDTLTIVSAEESTSSIQSPSFEHLEKPELECDKTESASGEESKEEGESSKLPEDMKELKTRDKGELVVVGSASDRTTPSSESMASNNTKDSSTLDDDWDQDFDLEVTEEDLKNIDEDKHKKLMQELDTGDDADDWENWE